MGVYGGFCAACGRVHALRCSAAAERAAAELMTELRRAGSVDLAALDPDPLLSTGSLYREDGQMFGVLVCHDHAGVSRTLRAFSGRFNGVPEVAGWVPPVPSAVVSSEAAEAEGRIVAIGRELADQRAALPAAEAEAVEVGRVDRLQLSTLDAAQAARRTQRHRRREQLRVEMGTADSTHSVAISTQLEALDDESRRDKSARRCLKENGVARLAPLQALRSEIASLEAQRRSLSRRLMTDLHRSYRLTNFRGETRPLVEIFVGKGIPSGAAECCAPKLLQAAAVDGLEPLGLAEFWWGASSAGVERQEGRIYPACVDKCQPILGFLLCGASAGVADERV